MTNRVTNACFPLLVFVVAILLGSTLSACPNCKDSLADGDPAGVGIVQGFFWSIIIMLATPALIIIGLGSYFYWLVRQAQAKDIAGLTGSPFAISGQPQFVEPLVGTPFAGQALLSESRS